MPNGARGTDSSLPEILAARARTATDASLAAAVGTGLVAMIAVGAWRPPHWLALVSACLCVSVFGVWGIADRELGERQMRMSQAAIAPLRFARVTAAALGTLSAIVLLFDLITVALGNWIS